MLTVQGVVSIAWIWDGDLDYNAIHSKGKWPAANVQNIRERMCIYMKCTDTKFLHQYQ